MATNKDISSLHHLSRDKYVTIAEDTLNKLKNKWYRSHGNHRINLEKDLIFSIDNSILYTEDALENIKEDIPTSITNVTSLTTKYEVRLCTTLQVAQSLVTEMDEDRIGILNFASAKNPGGGFLRGSSAQEESLARSSSLYLSISQNRFFNEFYGYHRRNKNGIYTHRIIYSPRVIVLKDDNGKLLSSSYHVGIVTVAAPNASIVQDSEAIRYAMKERIKRLLYVFEINQHDTLVLGAFGCGVFKNNPLEVAFIFRQHLESSEFKNSFKRIIFAI
ncbi:unnamed protein product [Adineta steineri]|uniref:Microbial-type PARG catalytic domain-containing protein n=1 Tax=Adineta steineri TaxID=433720 RepID=A0A815RLA7_9BILA|nr:unnamed protein product [Adineta steineri]CAF4151576.1 unnamed protein product [Adineta steineri]